MEPDAQSSVDAVSDSAVEALLANFYPADPTRLPALKWLGLVGAGVEHLRNVMKNDSVGLMWSSFTKSCVIGANSMTISCNGLRSLPEVSDER